MERRALSINQDHPPPSLFITTPRIIQIHESYSLPPTLPDHSGSSQSEQQEKSQTTVAAPDLAILLVHTGQKSSLIGCF